MDSEFRQPTAAERSLLERLLEAEFSGRDELAPLLRNVVVRNIDEDCGLELESQVQGKAPVTKRIPVEAEGKDLDGVVIHMLLHVVDGRPVELEFFREDGTTVRNVPAPAEFDLIVLPPTQASGSPECDC